MAKIDHIESISDKLAETTIVVMPKRCSYIRNWNSGCKACLNACPHDAIERSLGHLSINSELCTNCGSCVAACPTSSMLTSAPSAGAIVKEARMSAQVNGGHAVFACETLVQQEHLDTSKVVVVPCLDYMDEYLICGLFAFDIKSVNLIHGNCDDCESCGPTPRITHTAANARELLELWGIEARVRLTGKIPSQVRASRATARGIISGESRRDAFKQAGGSVLGYVAKAVSDAMDDIVETKPKLQPKKQITVRIDEVFPPDTYRSVRLLSMLDRLGTRPRGQMVSSRFWADVNIDPNECRHCGMCSKMCVTRALKFTEAEDGTRTLTFTPSLCINCHLCRDACLTHSMVYNTKLLADDLDSSKTRTLFVHKEEKKRTSFF